MQQTVALIRSTDGDFEPRYRAAKKFLLESGFQVVEIRWSRVGQVLGLLHESHTFRKRASYGRGIRNLTGHVQFMLFVVGNLRSLKPILIYACDLDALIPALLTSRRAKIIFDQFDPLSAKVNLGVSISRVLDLIEETISRIADIRITANIDRLSRFSRNSFYEVKNIFPIETSKNELLQRDVSSKFSNRKVLFYGGTLGKDRGLAFVSQAMRRVSDWKFEIYGIGPEFRKLNDVRAENVNFYGFVPHDELMSIAKESDLILAMYDPRFRNNQRTASNKLFESCQIGVPLLVNKGTKIAEVVEINGLGWSIDYGDEEGLLRVLENFNTLTEHELKLLKKRQIRYFEEESKKQSFAWRAIRKRVDYYVK